MLYNYLLITMETRYEEEEEFEEKNISLENHTKATLDRR